MAIAPADDRGTTHSVEEAARVPSAIGPYREWYVADLGPPKRNPDHQRGIPVLTNQINPFAGTPAVYSKIQSGASAK